MSTMTLLPRPDLAGSAITIRAPRRFDTHTVDEFRGRLDDASMRAGERVIDVSDVVFVDRDAVDALVAAGVDDPESGLRVEEPSLAFRLTLEMLGLGACRAETVGRAA